MDLKSSVAGSRNFKLHIDDRTLDHIQEKAMLRRGKIEGNAAEFYNILADEVRLLNHSFCEQG